MKFSTYFPILSFFFTLYLSISYDYIIITKNLNSYFPLYNTFIILYDNKISLDIDIIHFSYGFYFMSFIFSYGEYFNIHKWNFNWSKCIIYIIHCSIIDTLLAPLHFINIIYNISYISLQVCYNKLNITQDYYLERKLQRNIIKTSFIEQKPECCPICYDSFQSCDKPLSCGHYIHRNCIVLSKQTKCSICRSEIFLYRHELHTILNHNDYLDIARNSDCPYVVNLIDYIHEFKPICTNIV